MSMSREEIIDLATRYIPASEIVDFPMSGELFCFLKRDLPENSVLKDDEGWGFAGYGICSSYICDDDSKPHGKWVWFEYIDLSHFPPTAQQLKLQPPHIAKGRFQNPSRTSELNIAKLEMSFLQSVKEPDGAVVLNDKKPSGKSKSKSSAEILSFPGSGK